MRQTASEQLPLARDKAAWLGGLAVFIVHAALAWRYDVFRDELYFIVCGRHPAFGYVDQPPLIPLTAAALYALSPGAWLLRLPAALAAGLLVTLTVRLTRSVGGTRLAVVFAGTAVAIAPILAGLTAVLNTTALDPLAWTLVALLLVRAIRRDDDRALIALGLVIGIALEIKYALLLWGLGLAVGILATPQRVLLGRPALWLGLALAALIAAPSFVWQALHGFPFLELSGAAAGKNADVPLLSFLANQAFITNPFLAPLWLAGLAAPFASPRFKDLRFLPIAWLVYLAIVRLGHGKDYYLAATYPALFAIGAAALAPLVRTRAARIGTGATAAGAVAVSLIALPLTLPVLSPAALEAYIARTGLAPQQQERSFAGTVLPQIFADQLGWRTFVGQFADAWRKVPASERERTAILVENYGEAASLDLYGRELGLPPALSGHNQYFLWGLRGQHPVNLLVLTGDMRELDGHCRRATVLARPRARFAMASENAKTIVFCEGISPPLEEVWPRLKSFG
jgi:4-amino-4-deoxy-L-arabinose transferase-like glycosyltransferase